LREEGEVSFRNEENLSTGGRCKGSNPHLRQREGLFKRVLLSSDRFFTPEMLM